MIDISKKDLSKNVYVTHREAGKKAKKHKTGQSKNKKNKMFELRSNISKIKHKWPKYSN